MEEDSLSYGETMPINDYSEKQIRNQILKKIKPQIQKSRSPHQKGKIYIDKKVQARVKIPNDHSKIMRESKSKYIASALRLSHEQFNDLIDCPLTGPKYYQVLENKVK